MRRMCGLALFACLVFALAAPGCSKKADSADTQAESSETSEAPSQDAVPETEPPIEIILDEDEAETGTSFGETYKETSGEYYSLGEREEADGMIRSYLTGQMIPVSQGTRRPVAVMMSNDKQALPQYGINRAGVVYEAPVEGGMNRYMAILEDYDDLERIGSVRSCRTYYTYFAREFDAIYAHYGQSTFAKPYLSNVDNINGVESIGTTAYYRSSDKSSPHNAYTSAERLQQAIDKLGYSQDYDDSYEGHYLFAKDGTTAVLDERPGVMDASTLKTGYTLNEAYFVYNEEDGLYHRYQYSGVHSGSEGAITAKNIIVQFCQSGYYASTEYLAFNVHTTECGYFLTQGKAIPVNWTKDGEFGVTHYYDLNGDEIVLNQGQTWVCIVSTKDFSKVEIL